MKNLKKYLKYILLIIVGMILTNVLIFIGLNSNYKTIDLKGEVPEQISIEKAEATSAEARVYGYVSNNNDDLNGKYIQIIVYDSDGDAIGKKNLEIVIDSNEKKMFQANFNEDGIKSYSIDIVDSDRE